MSFVVYFFMGGSLKLVIVWRKLLGIWVRMFVLFLVFVLELMVLWCFRLCRVLRVSVMMLCLVLLCSVVIMVRL